MVTIRWDSRKLWQAKVRNCFAVNEAFASIGVRNLLPSYTTSLNSGWFGQLDITIETLPFPIVASGPRI